MALPKLATAAIFFHVAGNKPEQNYASAICKTLNLKSGTVVPVLNRSADRDGLLERQEQPMLTGRSRLLYSLTEAGQEHVRALLQPFRSRLQSIAAFADDAEPSNSETLSKINTSTIWLLAAAASSNGSTFGYSESMRPLTHQVAYVELQKLLERGWFATESAKHVVTAEGRRVMRTVSDSWLPLLNAADVRLREGDTQSGAHDE